MSDGKGRRKVHKCCALLWERSGSLIYKLTPDGWRRGREIFRNRIAVHTTFDSSVSKQEQDEFIEALHDFLENGKKP